MPRSSHSVFIKDDSEPENKKYSYCRKCEDEKSMLFKLVPKLLDDNTIDEKFKRCPQCGTVYPIYEIGWESQYEPKGYLNPNLSPFESGVKVSVIRNKRTNKANKVEAIEEIEIPKLGNMRDEFLEEIVKMDERPAVIAYINDVVVEGTDSEDY